MSPENGPVTEVTSESWGSRLMQSIKSVALGALIFIAAFPVLWKNEGCAVRTAKGLTEGAGAVVSVDAKNVDPANNGKLIHITGEAVTGDMLKDPVLNVSAQAIRLQRKVQMYQWQENAKTTEKKKIGGGVEKTTEYTYSKEWSSQAISSDKFKQKEGHANPGSMPIQDADWTAKNVTVGGYRLTDSLIGSISGNVPVEITNEIIKSLPANLRARAKMDSQGVFIGADMANPQVGDLKIQLFKVMPQTVSIVAKQNGSTFEPYMTKQGTSIEMLSAGTVSAANMFQQAQEANKMRTWLVRLAGLVMMFIGISMIFKPIVTFADVLPFLGSILNLGIGFFAGVIAFALSFVTIALAWIFYRPLLGIGLLVVGIGIFVAFWYMGKKKKAAATA